MANDTAYYVMDYIDGESLSEMVKRRGALPESEAIGCICAVADALGYVHKRKINHLDVKPGNIMVRGSDNHVFLLDFGLSKQYDTVGNQTSSTPLGISHGFAPIEQYSPEGIKEFSPQTDIYSLGATLYYLLTGIIPPPASELFSSELGGFPADLSASVVEAVKKAMRPQKKERCQDIDEFLNLLLSNNKIGGDTPIDNSVLAGRGQDVGEETVLQRPLITSVSNGEVRTPSLNETAQRTPIPKAIKRKRFFKIAGVIVGMAVVIWGSVLLFSKSAEELCQEGEQAYEQGDYTTAFPLFEKAARKGFAEAQRRLGDCYYVGRGCPIDYVEAVKWFREAAEQWNADAQNSLGVCYNYGQGVSQDYLESVKWYRKAAEQGNAIAQCNLGVMYFNGQGVPQNYSESVKWTRKAAEQGDMMAQYNMGVAYYMGQGVSQNYSEALKWYQKAAEQGYGLAVEAVQDIENNIQLNYQNSKSTSNKKANVGTTNNSVEEQFERGRTYYNSGKYSMAFQELENAAQKGYAPAQYYLGVMYEYGKGMKINNFMAKYWYEKAAYQNHAMAQQNLGIMYEEGRGVANNKAEALKWYRKAAEQGIGEAKTRYYNLQKQEK